MIHGFGGGGPVFCKMVAKMRAYYAVTTIDLLGLGASGRPEYLAASAEEATAFFLNSIHAWSKIAYPDNETFHLLGHSFGGFIAGAYALKYPD